jgi:uncharacterized protein
VQRRPDPFPVLRALVDARRTPGRYPILGSVSPDLLRQASASLAGRVRYLELGPPTIDEVGRGLGVSPPTVASCADILVGSFMVRRLEPDHANVRKRMVKSPKSYLRDSGVLHALLGIGDHDALLGHPVVGSSWEGFLMEQVVALVVHDDACFYRTAAGAEIDLVLRARGRWRAFEMKHTAAPQPTKGFWNAVADLEIDDARVLQAGRDHWPLADGVTAQAAIEVGT